MVHISIPRNHKEEIRIAKLIEENKKLSEEEYEEDEISNWSVFSGFVGTILGGVSGHTLGDIYIQNGLLVFAALLVGMLIGGWLFGKLTSLLKPILSIAFCLAIISLVGGILWNLIKN